MKMFSNPILPGFYPDPSICRVGDDYYLVTSSFEFFPGVPIFHSTDLVHWDQIGNVLDRPSQLDLDGCRDSGGIYAPTIRYYDGVFYMITTLANESDERGNLVNFICTAIDPAGPWSDPHVIADAPGIDPSLFFNADGRAWCHGNRHPENKKWEHHRQIWLQELDLQNFQLKGEIKVMIDAEDSVEIHGQDFCNAFEAPHIYEKDGWYYLLVAGGGTGWGHSSYIFRSRELDGNYEPCPANPIMTHRDLPSEVSEIHCPGHGDFVQTQNGEWWIVFLATRPYAGYHNYLGRETMMAPVDWSGDWPVISPKTGQIEMNYPVPQLPENIMLDKISGDNFDEELLGLHWNFIRTPREEWWSFIANPSRLRIKSQPMMLHELKNPAFIGRRVQDMEFTASTIVEFKSSNDNEEAGLALYKSSQSFFRLVITKEKGQRKIALIKRLIQDDRDSKMISVKCQEGRIYLRVDTNNRRYRFSWSVDGNIWEVLDNTFDVSCLSQVLTGGFTGIYVGMFSGSNEQPSVSFADFLKFEYRSM